MYYLTDAWLDHIAITLDLVKKILLSLNTNKAIGIDHILNCILKGCAESLSEDLAILSQQSKD